MAWSISKFSKTINNKWCAIEKSNMAVKLHFDDILITSDDAILQSFKLKYFIKGFLRNDVIVILYEEKGQNYKFKVRFSCNESEVKKLIKTFEMFFPVHIYKEPNDTNSNISTKNFQELIEMAISEQNTSPNTGALFPENFPLEQFVKTCLLDPNFSNFVSHIENIVKSLK